MCTSSAAPALVASLYNSSEKWIITDRNVLSTLGSTARAHGTVRLWASRHGAAVWRSAPRARRCGAGFGGAEQPLVRDQRLQRDHAESHGDSHRSLEQDLAARGMAA